MRLLILLISAGAMASKFPGQPKDFVIKGDVKNGEKLYKTNCALCHGTKGDGKGLAGEGLSPPPADFIHPQKLKTKSDWQQFLVTRDGGEAYGLSSTMASYKTVLTEQEIKEIILFIKTLPKP